jgi:hypothetical protein
VQTTTLSSDTTFDLRPESVTASAAAQAIDPIEPRIHTAETYAGMELVVVDAAVRALAPSGGVRFAMNSCFET